MQRFGPLAALAGEWEGEKGLDVSFHNADGEIGDTPYRETMSFKPFGPVDNGTQHLYGLDYRMAAWRFGEDLPFHTEVGYWLWCAELGHVMRCFVVPRGNVVMAGGEVAPDATTFRLRADAGHLDYGVLSNPYLLKNAKCTHYECTFSVAGDELTYEEDTVLEIARLGDVMHHTDRNVLRRVAAAEFPPEQ